MAEWLTAVKGRASFEVVLVCILLVGFAAEMVFGLYPTAHPWTMEQHDIARSGATASTAPNNNDTLWSIPCPSSGIPIVVNGMVVIDGGCCYMYALDETTGALLWKSSRVADVSKKATFADGRIFAGSSSGNLYCLNASTGVLMWNYTVEGSAAIIGNPAVYNGKVYFGTNGGHLYAINAVTGSYSAHYTAGGAIRTGSAIDGNSLYFGCDDKRLYALDISQPSFSLRWAFRGESRIHSVPVVDNEKVYCTSGSPDHSVYAVNKTTGELVWMYTFDSDWTVDNPVAVSDGLVYVAPVDGNKICALYANATGGMNYTENSPEILCWNQTIDNYPTQPVVADGKVFFGASHRMFALDALTGLIVWTRAYDLYTVAAPIVADGHVFFAQGMQVHCLGSPFPPLKYSYTVMPTTDHTYTIDLLVNATPSTSIDVTDFPNSKRISYNVTGIPGTIGMSNITFPNEMLGGPYNITVDGIPPSYTAPPVDNGTHTSLYFTYPHGTNRIDIVGTTAIPEYPPTAVLPFLVAASFLLAILARKRKSPKEKQICFKEFSNDL